MRLLVTTLAFAMLAAPALAATTPHATMPYRSCKDTCVKKCQDFTQSRSTMPWCLQIHNCFGRRACAPGEALR
jgi:hypothetical protein